VNPVAFGEGRNANVDPSTAVEILFKHIGEKMKKDRWFNVVIASVLIVQAALTVHQLAVTAEVVSANARQEQSIASADRAR
jgi:hypothetical protein